MTKQSTELATLDEDALKALMLSGDDEALRVLLGQGAPKREGLPRLHIQFYSEDNNEKKVPKGHFAIHDPDQDKVIYGAEAIFRPLVRMYQYTHWDQETEKFASTEQHATNGRGAQFKDTRGTFKLGRLTRKEREELGPKHPDVIVQMDVKALNLVYGTVTIKKGVDADGKKASCVDVACVWSAKGSSFMPVEDTLKEVDKAGKNMWEFPWTMTTKEQKNKAIKFHVPVVNIGARSAMTDELKELQIKFLMTIQGSNEYVRKEWTKNTTVELTDEEAALAEQLGE